MTPALPHELPPADGTLRLPRSPLWADLRDKWLLHHPTCAACGGRVSLQVHHKIPVHVNRSLELSPTNLITLCESVDPELPALGHCHLRYGHLGSWFNYNRNVEIDAHKALMNLYAQEGRAPQPPADPTIQPPKAPTPEALALIEEPPAPPTSTDPLLAEAPSLNPASPAPGDPAPLDKPVKIERSFRIRKRATRR